MPTHERYVPRELTEAEKVEAGLPLGIPKLPRVQWIIGIVFSILLFTAAILVVLHGQ